MGALLMALEGDLVQIEHQHPVGLESGWDYLEFATERRIAPTHEENNQDMKEILELRDPDLLRLLMSWDVTIGPVHGKEAATLGTKLHDVGSQYLYIQIMRNPYRHLASGPLLSQAHAIF